MDDLRTKGYAQKLSALIQKETVSAESLTDKTKFYEFQDLLRALFPRLFSVCEFENFNGSFLMTWRGQGQGEPVLLMNHQDVVEAPGEWKYPPFAGTIADGRVWGRGALDTKGGLFAMLQAAEELLEEGFVPKRDMYFMSTCTEECDGVGAETISKVLLQRGLRFHLVLDEGGMVVINPLTGANGSFAMVGVGEKGCADLKFIARSTGGHASTPEKNTPLVWLGKFMAAVERKQLFKKKISATVSEMFSVLSSSMRGPVKFVLKHTRLFEPILVRVMPWLSNTAAAMLQTTIAFTMADGSAGANVLPQEAWVIGNMRYSHHQGRQKSFRAVAKLAEKYGIETVVLDPGCASAISPYDSEQFKFLKEGVKRIYPDVETAPYVMNSASDCRYMSCVSEHCLRFTPFLIDDQQLESIHGVNENVNLSALAPAVDFYRYVIREV